MIRLLHAVGFGLLKDPSDPLPTARVAAEVTRGFGLQMLASEIGSKRDESFAPVDQRLAWRGFACSVCGQSHPLPTVDNYNTVGSSVEPQSVYVAGSRHLKGLPLELYESLYPIRHPQRKLSGRHNNRLGETA